jgi:peptidoglycan/xylan/chitin deacetylase (PgdA/CDA1 family)
VAILCYHAIDPEWVSPLAISSETFRRQCAWLGRHRHPVDLSEAVGHVDRAGLLPRGMVVLTFDDGFATVYEHAFPILKASGLPATVFLVAETLSPEGRTVDWVAPWDNPPPTPLPTLSLDQILEMQEAGISFGSHSYAHHDLTRLGEQECERDLADSRELLESLLGRPVPFLAFPFGRHDERVRRAARRAGYQHAFSLPDVPEEADPHALPRMGVLPPMGLGMLAIKTSSWYPRLRVTPPYAAARRLLGRARAFHHPDGVLTGQASRPSGPGVGP